MTPEMLNLVNKVLNRLLMVSLSNMYESSSDFESDRRTIYNEVNEFRRQFGLEEVGSYLDEENDNG